MQSYEGPAILASYTIEELTAEAAVCMGYGDARPVVSRPVVSPPVAPPVGGPRLPAAGARGRAFPLGGLAAAGAAVSLASGYALQRAATPKGDAEAHAEEQHAAKPTRPKRPEAELVPVSEMLAYIRERDERLEDMQRQLTEATGQITYLREQLEQRLLPEVTALSQRVQDLERERDELEAKLKPWWRRVLHVS